jgi:SAM-dependent methyltransferase
MEPYGLALMDYFNGDHSAKQTFHRDDGIDFEMPISGFFRGVQEFSRIERAALDLCRGKVLDIGAGSGHHSLVLQERGLNVVALDVSPEAIEIMKRRGVKTICHADIFELESGTFDTLLMLGHGIGMVGDLSGLRRFLVRARTLIGPGGILVCDSLDVRCTSDPVHLAYHDSNRKKNRYIGEIHFQIEYKGKSGKPFSWLQLDPETLCREAMSSGWSCEINCQEPWGDYLAQLNLS